MHNRVLHSQTPKWHGQLCAHYSFGGFRACLVGGVCAAAYLTYPLPLLLLLLLQLVVGLSERAGESLPFVLVAAKDDLGMSNVSGRTEQGWQELLMLTMQLTSAIRDTQGCGGVGRAQFHS
jgi:hypothetical protein